MQTLPEAIDAQKSLDALVAQWEGDLQKMQAEWKRKFDDYEKKRLIMTDQVRARDREAAAGPGRRRSPTSGTRNSARTARCSRSRTRS